MDKVITRYPKPEKTASWSETLDPLLQRIYQHRGITSLDELTTDLNQLPAAEQLLGIDKAVACLTNTFNQQQRVLVIGDFDADGATSSVLMLTGLRALGLQHVDYLVPNRFEYGYGLTPEIVDVAKQRNPNMIITVDNGISSLEGVAEAKHYGMQVIITDHHLPGESLPNADAIINPNQSGCSFPSKCLAGVGVAFYVIIALRRHLRECGWFQQHNIDEPALSPLFDLVALGTVADVVPLDHTNRILVHHGLQRIRNGYARPGIIALLTLAKRDHRYLTSADLGFALGPRLNAAGRLEDMSIGIQCLLADSLGQARLLAARLDSLNQQRKTIETTMQQQALDTLTTITDNLQQHTLPLGICLYDPSWHQGVIGIVASRLKDLFYRPVIAFAKADDNTIKGSARSINNIHIRDCLSDIATQHPDLIITFGGHAMAAGLTIREADFGRFQQIFTDHMQQLIEPDQLQHIIHSDGELTHEQFTNAFAEQLRDGGPWGQHFPEPLFDGEFYVIDYQPLGTRHAKLGLCLQPHDEYTIEALLFNIDKLTAPPQLSDRIHIAYRLQLNTFRNQQTVQLIIEYVQCVSNTVSEMA